MFCRVYDEYVRWKAGMRRAGPAASLFCRTKRGELEEMAVPVGVDKLVLEGRPPGREGLSFCM